MKTGRAVFDLIDAPGFNVPKPTPGVCECDPPCIPGIPIVSNSQNQRVSNQVKLTESEKTIAFNLGVSEAAQINAKVWNGRLGIMRASSFPDHRPDNFGDNRGGGREAVDAHDADEGIPRSDDDSVAAHVKRARNHLEAFDDADGDEAMCRLQKARDCLSRAIDCKAGVNGRRVGVRFAK